MRLKTTRKASKLKKIGLIKPDGTVERGSYRETVFGIQILPISSLVKVPFLHLAMQKARVEYSSTKGNQSSK